MDVATNSLIMLTGGGLCCLVVAIGVKDLWRWRRRQQARRQRMLESRQAFCNQVAGIAQRVRLASDRLLAWEGLRQMRVVAVVDECPESDVDIKSFYLSPVDGRPLPRYLPGQYLTLHLPAGVNKDPKTGASKPTVRCYSLSDRSREEAYRVTVKRQLPPSDQPNQTPGVGSSWLHDHVRVGDLLPVEAPRGLFYLPLTDTAPIVLIGAGIGMTPLWSMVCEVIHSQPGREVHLFLGARNRKELAFAEEIERVASSYPNLHVYFAFSRPDQADAKQRRPGRVTMDLLKKTLPSSNFRFYLCGPAGLLEAIIPGLLSWGVPDDHINYEAFGPSSIKRPGAEDPWQQAIGALVTFARGRQEAVWQAEHRSLLEMAEEAGLPVGSGCRIGNCGQCLTGVLQGKVRAVKSPGAAVPDGTCLACISVPEGPVVLDV